VTRRRTPALVLAAVTGAVALSSCGGGEHHVALAIEQAERSSGTVVLTVECATGIDVDRRPDPAGSGLDQVTVWGDPKTGTCHPDVTLDDLPQDKFVDGASSQVVTVTAPA
jgi:hypothetical protein